MIATTILGASVVVQFAAAAISLVMVTVVRWRGAWLLLTAAMTLMAVRSAITLIHQAGDLMAEPADLTAEVVAFVISLLTLAGFAFLGAMLRRADEAGRALDVKSVLLERTLNSVDQGISMIDSDLRVVLLNKRAADLLDFPRHLLDPGAPLENLFRHNAERGEYGPGDPESQVRERMALAARMEPHRFDRERPDGTVIEVHGRPLAGGGGFVTTYTDVTEQRRSDQALEESRKRSDELNDQLTDAIEAMPASFVFHDHDGRLVMSNRKTREYFPELRHLFGQGARWKDIVGYAFDNELWCATPEERRCMRAERLAHRHSGESQASEQQWHDGRWFQVFESQTRSGGWVGIRVDVTDRKQAEEELVAANQKAELANRAKSEFLANMSHELRTPLNAIIGFTEILQRELFGPLDNERYKEYLADIHQSGIHLAEILGDILDLSRIEAGKAELSASTIDLAGEVEVCLRVVRQRAAENGLALHRELEGAPASLLVDARMFRQILINLLSNAVKFTPEGGSATVFARRAENGGCLVGVRDTGIGMAPDDVARAMAVFGQVESVLSRRVEGSGLGLPLTVSLVELHGGTFRLDSALGEGTTALCHLPPSRVVASKSLVTA